MKLLIALLLVFAVNAARAAEPGLESVCLDCHHPGAARGEVPLIEGQNRDYLHNQLSRFKVRHRDSFPMSALAAGLGEADLERIADWLAQREWRSSSAPAVPAAAARGRLRVEQLACDSCHGEQFYGIGDIPRLAGQQPSYLRRALREFGAGERYHPPTGIGTRIYQIDADESADIATFLHALAPAASAAGEDGG